MNNKLKSIKILKYAKKIKHLNSIGGRCIKCNEDNLFKLTFHHYLDKEFSYSDVKNLRYSYFENEIKKCYILCQNCHREHHYNETLFTDKRRDIKKSCLEYSSNECLKCGYNKCPASLTFHHRNKDTKLFSIANIYLSDLNNFIKNEIDKCDVLCANCHILEHSDYDFFIEHKNEILNKVLTYKEKQSKINRSEVISMYNNNVKQSNIAKHFNASNGTISDIIKEYKNGEKLAG